MRGRWRGSRLVADNPELHATLLHVHPNLPFGRNLRDLLAVELQFQRGVALDDLKEIRPGMGDAGPVAVMNPLGSPLMNPLVNPPTRVEPEQANSVIGHDLQQAVAIR